jgi:hypothetical protein
VVGISVMWQQSAPAARHGYYCRLFRQQWLIVDGFAEELAAVFKLDKQSTHFCSMMHQFLHDGPVLGRPEIDNVAAFRTAGN